MPISEAVKKFMRVPKGAGNSVPWDPELTPYIIEPMNCLASREYDAVIFVGPARTGKTIGLIDGWIVYTIVCDPSDMLVVQMTEDKAREHSKKRLDRTFRSSAAVKKRMSPRRNDNNVHDKTFRDGSFLKIGWPSVNIMSSSDYRFVALTDYDRFPENIDSEGDGFSLASKRTTTFMSAGMTLVESSPGRDICDSKWRRKSPHEAPPTTGILSLYNRGDRRRWYWPCPHCGEYFQPAMDAMTGYRNEPDPFKASEAAYLLCPHCSGIITAEKKRELNSAGVWLREGQVIDRNGNVSGEPRRSRIASFWMEGPAAAYQTWAQLVYKLLTAEQEYEATGSEETLRAVINTDWGLPYLPRASMEQRKSELLEQRAEPVPSRSVPDGVNFLVATVDVQAGRHRRFVVQVTGYGSRGERWIIDRYNITQSLRGDSDGESQRIDPASYVQVVVIRMMSNVGARPKLMKTASWTWYLIPIRPVIKEAAVPQRNDRSRSTPTTSPKNNSWFRMQAGHQSDADIYIYDEIGFWGVTAKQFISDLNALGDITHINLHINSPGGDVFEGIAIFNALKTHGASITVYVDGVAASMASVIAMVGNPVIMPENTFMMIHKPFGFTGGDAEDMRT